MTDKYQAACVEYAAAAKEVKRLSEVIGDALSDCIDAQINERGGGWEAALAGAENHLGAAYQCADYRDIPGGSLEYAHHDGRIEKYLSGVCSHCLAAHLAIQERKEARKRFGAAKRRIAMLGAKP